MALAIPVVAGSMPVAATAAEASAPVAVENFAYPDAAKILAERNITLKSGDGHIVLADCTAGPGQVQLYSRAANPSEVCFKINGPAGYLALEIPKIYNIKGDDHTVKATVSTDGTTSTIDLAKNVWTPVGEGGTAGSETTLLELNATGGPAAPANTDFPAVGTVTAGQAGRADARSCTATLVDRYWVLTAAGCIGGASGAPAADTTATVSGHTATVAELVTRSDRDLVLARLATPIDGVTPAALATAAPTSGQSLRVAGFGRTATEWAPLKPHAATHTTGTVAATTVDTTPAAGNAAVCQGDAGAPLLRDANGTSEVVAVASRSWQGGCLGTPATETRTGATSTRVDDVAGWVQQVRATALGWKTQALVKGDTGLFQATRLYDGTWTPFEDVQAKAGNIGGVKAVSAAGINGDTHIVALGGDGHLHHTIHTLAGAWGGFGDLNTNVGDLGRITQVSVSSTGANLQVVVLADGQIFHTIRSADGTWAGFSPVFSVAGSLNGVTAVAVAGTGNDLQVAAIANGRVYHTARIGSTGVWGAWGAVADAAGDTGSVTSVAMARQGNDMNLVVVTDTGAQYHTVRFSDGTWQPFGPLTSVLGQVTATSVSAAPVDGDAQFAFVTSDNRVITVGRLADRTWSAPTALNLQGVNGNHTGTAIAGTL
ncbi:trypsin-like serine protease [Kitasatospora sp. NPDC059803]|uniref:trypsin-like serine protease n=1 Tax=Kitasatospora sp. NPDC059803 TaxID=3346953 RepID=UPI003664E695